MKDHFERSSVSFVNIQSYGKTQSLEITRKCNVFCICKVPPPPINDECKSVFEHKADFRCSSAYLKTVTHLKGSLDHAFFYIGL